MRRWVRWIVWILAGAIGVIVGIRYLVPIGYTLIYTGFVPYRVTVTGQVTDSQSAALAGATVRAVPAGVLNLSFGGVHPRRVTTATTTCDASGHYRLKRLIGGFFPSVGDGGRYVQQYDIVAEAEGYAPRKTRVRHIPVNLPIREGDDRRVKRNKTFAGIDFALDRESSVSGRAVDTRGRPFSGRIIQPVLLEEPQRRIRNKVIPDPVLTDADGRFRFARMSPGTYLFQTEAYGERPGWWDPSQGFYTPQMARHKPVALAAGEGRDGLELVFEAPEDRGHLAGHVIDAGTGEPIEAFTVRIPRVQLAGEGTAALGLRRSNNKLEPIPPYDPKVEGRGGAFRIESITPGAASLVIRARGYATTRPVVAVAGGRTVETTFALVRESRLRGTVYYRGTPADRAYVSLDGPDALAGDPTRTKTNARGHYAFGGLAAGDYQVYASLRTHEEEPVAWATDCARVRVEARRDAVRDLQFQGKSGIRGTVTVSDRKMSPQIMIEAAPDPSTTGVLRYRRVFWVNGAYEILGIPPGRYTVTGECFLQEYREPAWLAASTSQTVAIAPGRLERVDFDFRGQ